MKDQFYYILRKCLLSRQDWVKYQKDYLRYQSLKEEANKRRLRGNKLISFTYNLVHYLEDLNCKVEVFRNDKIDLKYVDSFSKILLSPGPGIPDEAGLLKSIILKYYKTKNFLGVCLGHQAIAEALGCELLNLNDVFHGISTDIKICTKDILFSSVPEIVKVGRYHSWVVKKLTDDFELLAEDFDNNIMAFKHKKYKLWGVQFHPESILTDHGKTMLKNWINT